MFCCRDYLRLGSPLCCTPIDEPFQVDTGAKQGGIIPVNRVRCIVTMTTPRDVNLHGAAITPPFVEFNMAYEGFGCIYIPSIAPQGPPNPSVVGVTGSADVSIVGGVGTGECKLLVLCTLKVSEIAMGSQRENLGPNPCHGGLLTSNSKKLTIVGLYMLYSFRSLLGERVFPPAAGLTFSSWHCVEKLVASKTSTHPVRLLQIVRKLTDQSDSLICLSAALDCRDKALIISTEETLMPKGGECNFYLGLLINGF